MPRDYTLRLLMAHARQRGPLVKLRSVRPKRILAVRIPRASGPPRLAAEQLREFLLGDNTASQEKP